MKKLWEILVALGRVMVAIGFLFCPRDHADAGVKIGRID